MLFRSAATVLLSHHQRRGDVLGPVVSPDGPSLQMGLKALVGTEEMLRTMVEAIKVAKQVG